MAPEPISVSTVALVSGEYKIIASAVGTRQGLSEVLQLASEGKAKCRIETRAFDDVWEIMNEMREGKLVGRVVLKMAE